MALEMSLRRRRKQLDTRVTVTDGFAALVQESMTWCKYDMVQRFEDSQADGRVLRSTYFAEMTIPQKEQFHESDAIMTRLHKFQEEISLLTIFLVGQKFQKSSPHSSADHGPSWLSPQAHGRCPDLESGKVSPTIQSYDQGKDQVKIRKAQCQTDAKTEAGTAGEGTVDGFRVVSSQTW